MEQPARSRLLSFPRGRVCCGHLSTSRSFSMSGSSSQRSTLLPLITVTQRQRHVALILAHEIPVPLLRIFFFLNDVQAFPVVGLVLQPANMHMSRRMHGPSKLRACRGQIIHFHPPVRALLEYEFQHHGALCCKLTGPASHPACHCPAKLHSWHANIAGFKDGRGHC